jgi:hypothetical protein
MPSFLQAQSNVSVSGQEDGSRRFDRHKVRIGFLSIEQRALQSRLSLGRGLAMRDEASKGGSRARGFLPGREAAFGSVGYLSS